jgi:hypothetical protein
MSDRLVNVCPNCNHGDYLASGSSYKCDSCGTYFNTPNLIHDNGSVLEYNKYFNVIPMGDFLLIDGLSFGLLERLNKELSTHNKEVSVDFNTFQVRLKVFRDTNSEFSKLRLLKVREDYLDHQEEFDKLRRILNENKEASLTSDTFGENIKIPVYFTRLDMFDLEELAYKLVKELEDSKHIDNEVNALLDMCSTINEQMMKVRGM